MICRILVLAAVVGCGGHPAAPRPVESKPDVPPPVVAPPASTASPEMDAIQSVDETDPRSIDRALKAVAELEAKPQSAALATLVELAKRPATKKLIVAQVDAIRALGKLEAAASALAEIIERDPPPHPSTAPDREQARSLEVSYTLHLTITGASVNALGELRAAAAVGPLVRTMFRTPELFTQTRRALVAIGPATEVELRAILRGENTAVNNLFAARKLDRYCPPDGGTCMPVSARDFYPAVVLGDFYDRAAVPELLTALQRPPLPFYYLDDAPSPNTQYNAIYDALRKIGAPEAAGPVRAAWSKNQDLSTRVLAIGAYPFVSRDDLGVDALGKIAADNTADDGLRQEAATAFARLAHDISAIAVLDQLASKYFEAAAKKRKEADGKPKAAADAADRAYNAATKAGGDLSAAKKKHKEAVRPFKQLDSAAKAYKGYARMFQTHIARIEIAIRCKEDVACYGASLKLTTDAAAYNLAAYIKDLAEWTADEKLGLLEANIERAMLELGKRGGKASAQTDALLDAIGSDNRLVRQSILLALPRIAKLPCVACAAKLDAAIKAAAGKPALVDLTLETTMLRNYFAWAGH